jgi:20S proteasome subunit beta 4
VYASSAAGTETLIGVVGKDYIMIGADSSVSQSIVLTSSDVDKIDVISDPFPEETRKSQDREQQTMVVAAAGEFADVDRLVSYLRASAAQLEFDASIGCDVNIIDLESNGEERLPPMPPGLSVSSLAKLARGTIANKLRSQNPFRLGVLIAGMQHEEIGSGYESKEILKSTYPFSFISEEVQKQIQEVSPTIISRHLEMHNDKVSEPQGGPHDLGKSALRPHLYWLDEYGSLQKLKYASHGLGSNFLLAILDQGYKENLSREQAAELIQSCFNQLQTRYLINSPKPPIIKCIDANGCRRVV